MDKDSFVFFRDWALLRESMPPEQYNALVAAIVDYGLFGIEPEDTSPAFTLIKMQIDRNALRYQTICNKRREAASKRWARFHEAEHQQQAAADTPDPDPQPADPAPPPDPQPEEVTPETVSQLNLRYLRRYFDERKRSTLDAILKQLHTANPATSSLDQFKLLAWQVICEWEQNEEPPVTNYTEWSKHLLSTIRIKNNIEARNATANQHIRPDADAAQSQRRARQAEFVQRLLASPQRGGTLNY